MTDAIAALGFIVGGTLDRSDQSWLREKWQADARDDAQRTIAGLEAFAVALEPIKDGTDSMTLAQLRSQVIDETYCAARRTSDPVTQRQRRIFAPDSLVIAGDCVAGFVATTFDVHAQVRSNALAAEIVGQAIDKEKTQREQLKTLPGAFATLSSDERQRLLSGESRAAALQTVWSAADEDRRAELAQVAREAFNETGDVALTAMRLELSALESASEARPLASRGAYRFGAADMAAYLDYFEFIVDTKLSPKERAEITGMFITNFHENPQRTIQVAADLREWLKNGFHFGKDPNTGRIRSWTAQEQATMRAERAAGLYCLNNVQEDPDGLRLIDILYSGNPVVEIDCDTQRIVRQRDAVVAKTDERMLTRAALDAHRRAFEILFALRFTEAERLWFDQASIADISDSRDGLSQSVESYQENIAYIRTPAPMGPHLNEQRREDIAIRAYCANKDNEHPDVIRLFTIIDAHDPIVYEDCARTLIVRESDLRGLAGHFDFIASLRGFEPLTQKEIRALPKTMRREFEAAIDGPRGYASTMIKYTYWWSRMPTHARYATAALIEQKLKSRDDIFVYNSTLSLRATGQLALLALCDLNFKKLRYDTLRVGMSTRAIINTNPYASGSPWLNPESIDDDVAFFNLMAPFVQQQCAAVWK